MAKDTKKKSLGTVDPEKGEKKDELLNSVNSVFGSIGDQMDSMNQDSKKQSSLFVGIGKVLTKLQEEPKKDKSKGSGAVGGTADINKSLSKLNESILAQTAIQSALLATIAGAGKKLPNVKTLAKQDLAKQAAKLSSIISGLKNAKPGKMGGDKEKGDDKEKTGGKEKTGIMDKAKNLFKKGPPAKLDTSGMSQLLRFMKEFSKLNIKDNNSPIFEIFTPKNTDNIINFVKATKKLGQGKIRKSVANFQLLVLGDKKSQGIGRVLLTLSKEFNKKDQSESKKIIALILGSLTTIATGIKALAKAAVFSKLAVGTIRVFVQIVHLLKDAFSKGTFGSETDNVIAKVAESLERIGGTIIKLALVAVLTPIAAVSVLFIYGTLRLFQTLGKGSKSKKLRRGIRSLTLLGFGLITFVVAATLFAVVILKIIVPLVLGILLISAVGVIFTLLGTLRKKIKKGSKALIAISIGLVAFTLGAFALTLVMMVSPLHLLAGIAVIGMMGLLFTLLGVLRKRIIKGAFAMLAMSIGLVIFSAALYIMTLAMKNTTWKMLAMMGAAIAGMGLAAFGIGSKLKTIVRGAIGLAALGVSLMIFSVGLLIFSKASKDLTWDKLAMLGATITGLGLAAFVIGEKIKTILKGALGLAALGFSLMIFSVGLLIFSKASKNLTWDRLAILGATITGLGLAAFVIGGKINTILKGALGLAALGINLIIFSIGLLILSKASKDLTWDKLAMLGAVITGLGIAAAVIGQNISTILIGAVGLAALGVNLIIFATGMLIFSKASKNLTWDKLLMLGAVITGLGLAAAVLGIPPVSGFVLMGALVLTALAVPLIAFGFAIGLFGDSADKLTEKNIKMTGEFISMLAFNVPKLVLATVGLPALLGISAALPLLAKGLQELSKVPEWTEKQSENFSFLMGALVSGMLETVWPPWHAAGVLASIPLVVGMGVALQELSKGLQEASKFNWAEFDIVPIQTVLVGLAEAFAMVGQASGEGKGMLGGITSMIGISPNSVLIGIKSVSGASKALTEVGKGVKAFFDMTDGMPKESWAVNDDGSPAEGSVPQRIATVLGVIGKVFGDIGASGNTNDSLIGMVFGSDMKKSDTEVGIESTKKVGKTLISVTEGVQAFYNMSNGMGDEAWAVNEDDSPAEGSVPHRIATVLGVIGKVFGDIGASGNTNNSLIGMIFGSDMKKSDVEVGIDSTKKVGRSLISVAQGVEVFFDLTKDMGKAAWATNSDDSPSKDSIPYRISTVLGVVNKVFADIGKQGSGGSLISMVFGNDFSQNSVKVGSESVEMAGKALSKIGASLGEFWKFTESLGSGVWDLDSEGKFKDGTIPHRISTVLGVVNSVFSEIGNNKPKSVLGLLSTVFLGTTLTTSDTDKGIESVKNAGSSLIQITKGLGEFIKMTSALGSNAFKSIGTGKNGRLLFAADSIPAKIISVLGVINQSFGEIGRNAGGGSGGAEGLLSDVFGSATNDNFVKKGIESVKGIGEIFTGIAGGMKSFANVESMLGGATIAQLGINIGLVLTVISGVFQKIGEGGGSGGMFSDGDIQDGVEAVQGIGAVFGEIATGMKEFATLQQMGLSPEDFKVGGGGMVDNIKNIMMAVTGVFADIGKQNGDMVEVKDSEDQTHMVSKGDAAKGVKSVAGSGKILKNIAAGVKVFADLSKPGKDADGNVQDPIKIDAIGANITEILQVVNVAFAKIGSGDGNKVTPEAVALGIKAVKGSGDILSKIAGSLKPFMDLEKGIETTDKDGKKSTKPFELEKIKKNMAEVIALSFNIMAAVGDKEAGKKFFGNLGLKVSPKGYDPAVAENAKQLFEKVGALTKPMKDTAGLLADLDIKDFESKKVIYSKIAGLPMAAISVISGQYKDLDKGVITNILSDGGVLAQMNKRISEGDTILKSLENRKFGKNGPIQSLAFDMGAWMNKMGVGITDKKLEATTHLVDLLKNLAWIADPFTRFQESFSIFSGDFILLLNSIKSMDLKKIEGVTALQKENINLALAPADVAETNMKNIKDYMEVVLAISQEDIKTLEGVFEKLIAVQQKMIDSTAAQADAPDAQQSESTNDPWYTKSSPAADAGEKTAATVSTGTALEDILSKVITEEGMLVRTSNTRNKGGNSGLGGSGG